MKTLKKLGSFLLKTNVTESSRLSILYLNSFFIYILSCKFTYIQNQK